ncbi:hypothetical protein [Halosolutus gelatinilyticus]|uniref:hypothetical protein n=1 Tax=Halosolutus gelatinilyticus TaxID=2931975 RepID=UPI001FF244C9|nr:hypothetical protein [Halosolutus gelatinilyticus]
MVDERITDGRRIAELLASELEGREDGGLDRIAVTNADRDVEPTADGERAYDVARADGTANGNEARLARVFVHDDRARVEFDDGQDAAVDAAADAGLRVRPKATSPPKTLVFVESGAEVKRATDAFQAVIGAVVGDDQDRR